MNPDGRTFRATGRARLAGRLVLAAGVFAAGLTLAAAQSSGSGTRQAAASASGNVLLGVAGNTARFKDQTGQESSVDQAFLGWGQGQTWGSPFAVLLQELGPIPMLHLGTTDQHGHEAITPADIAEGKGDSYLIALNNSIASYGRGVYVRPLAEMNNAANLYSGFTAAGQPKDAAHAPGQYRKAFARIYVILHGGTGAQVDARLRALGLPPLQAGTDVFPNPFPTLRIVWSPLASNNPEIPANVPSAYYPGAQYVDVEGGDIYDEQATDTAPWSGLESLYEAAKSRGKPFSVPEWGLLGLDDAAFVRHMCTFLGTSGRIEVSVFYESKPGSREDLGSKPASRQAYSDCVVPLAAPLPGWAGAGARALALSLVGTPASGAAPLSVSFRIGAKLSVPIQHWQLLFGDGGQAQADGEPPAAVQHTYDRAGSYQAILFVYRSPPFAPETTPFLVAASVEAGTSPGPLLSFVPNRGSGNAPLSVSFRSELALGAAPTGYTIAWGDGTSRTGTGAPPHFTGHTFARDGAYDVLLLVTAAGGRQFGVLTQLTAGAGGAGGGGGGGGGGTPSTTTTTTTTGGSSPPASGRPTGTVLVNGAPFTGGTLPPGATVDVTHGDLLLSSGGGSVHLFGSGVSAKFRLLRGTDNGKPAVVIELVGGDFSVCGTRKGTRKVAAAVAAKPKTTTVRQLWGNGKGHFTTRGRYGAASVRGTYWLTRDRCDGTLIVVRRGVVAVFVNRTGKTVLVRAGHRLLIRP